MPEKTVLVVEDAAATSELLRISLTLDGFNVIERQDGISGLEAALEMSPDIVLLDIALPGMDGWELLKRFRADPRGRSVPVVVMTAHDVAAAVATPAANEAQRVIGKPFDLSELRSIVQALLADQESPITQG